MTREKSPAVDVALDPRLDVGALNELRRRGFSDAEIIRALNSVKRDTAPSASNSRR